MTVRLAAFLLALLAASSQTRPSTVTSLWRDTPADRSRVRIDLIPDVTEASDLLLRRGSFYTVSDSFRMVYQLDFAGPGGAVPKTPR